MRGNKYSFVATPLPHTILFSLVQQALVVILGSMIHDGGALLQTFLYGIAGFWIGVCLIWFRRGASLTKADVTLVRWGVLPMCVISFLLTGGIWHLRGYDGLF
jgi:hypothetical protein